MFNLSSKIIISDNKLGIKKVSFNELLRGKKDCINKSKDSIVSFDNINSYILSFNFNHRKIDWDQIIRVNIEKRSNVDVLTYLFEGNNGVIIKKIFSENKIFNIDRTKGFMYNVYLHSGIDTVLGEDGKYYKYLDRIGNVMCINDINYLISIETRYNKCYFVDGFLFKSDY